MTSLRNGPSPTEPAELVDLFTRLAHHRAHEPVVFNDSIQAWEAFSHRDVTRILSDPATFSSDMSALVPSDPDIDKIAKGNLISIDPPLHRQMRGLVSKAFTPKFVAELAPRITEVTAELLDGLAGRERFDLVHELSYPLPVIVISEMIGIPSSDRETFQRWADVLLNNEPPADEPLLDALGDQVAAIAPTVREMGAYMLEHVRRRRVNPTDDLVTALVDTQVDGRSLDDDEIVWFTALLLLAGHITTTALLGNTLLCLDSAPEVVGDLRADRDLVPGMLEEVLRMRPPFTKLARLTTADVELSGTTIPAGQIVFAWLASANRDESVFTDPEVFDPRRESAKQAGFGHGIHFCLGAPLARLEAKIAVNLLLDRYRDIRVDPEGEIDFFDVHALLGAKSVPVLVRPS